MKLTKRDWATLNDVAFFSNERGYADEWRIASRKKLQVMGFVESRGTRYFITESGRQALKDNEQ